MVCVAVFWISFKVASYKDTGNPKLSIPPKLEAEFEDRLRKKAISLTPIHVTENGCAIPLIIAASTAFLIHRGEPSSLSAQTAGERTNQGFTGPGCRCK
jgi:hypothetical protein